MPGKMSLFHVSFRVVCFLSFLPWRCAGGLELNVSPYPARVYANATRGVTVATVRASDNKTGPVTTLSLGGGNDSRLFSVDSVGVIRTARRIDREINDVIQFKVLAEHNKRVSEAAVKIIVSKKNREPPTFQKSSYSFPFSPQGVNTVIGHVVATDNDTEKYNSHFTIFARSDQRAADYIKVSKTGELTLTKPVPESTAMLDLVVHAVDSGSPQLTGTTTVTAFVYVPQIKHPDRFCFRQNSTTIKLCWKNPMPNKKFKGYKVKVTGPNTDRQGYVVADYNQPEPCYIFTGAKKGSIYYFTVSVDSDQADGEGQSLRISTTGAGHHMHCLEYKFSSCSYTMMYPCSQHGQCKPKFEGSTNEHVCICDIGYSGQACEIRAPCSANPCLQGQGVCKETAKNTDYTCECNPGYYGNHCEKANRCVTTDKPCQPDAICRNTTDSYDCVKCPDDTCLNDGSCLATPEGDDFRCECPNGYDGDRCQHRLCGSKRCVNGNCVSQRHFPIRPRCTCLIGYYGETCESYDVCKRTATSMCSGHGNCSGVATSDDQIRDPTGRTKTGYDCLCEEGFEGDRCQNYKCHLPEYHCQNGGRCISANHTTLCDCPERFKGDNCAIEECSSCLNGGNCTVDPKAELGFRCECAPAWGGPTCDRCSDNFNTCKNGARCEVVNLLPHIPTHGYWQPKCFCQEGFAGKHCQLEKPCTRSPCVHGECINQVLEDLSNNEASTYDLSSFYNCNCDEGFSGQNCDMPIDRCHDNICVNGGKCDQAMGMCECQPPYTGTTCEDKIPDEIPDAGCTEYDVDLNDSCRCIEGKIVCTQPPTATGLTASCEDRGYVSLTKKDGTIFCASMPAHHLRHDAVFQCCSHEKSCSLYEPDCFSRAHCSESGVLDTSCLYFVTNCDDSTGKCLGFKQLVYSCADLTRPGDDGWVECASVRLNVLSTSDPQGLGVDQVALYGMILEGLREASLTNKTIAQLAMNSISTLASVNVSVSLDAERNNQTNTRLRDFIDDYTARVQLDDSGSIEINSSVFTVRAEAISFSDDSDFVKFVIDEIGDKQMPMSIEVHKGVLQDKGAKRIQFVAYSTSQLFLSANTTSYNYNDKQTVISATVTNHTLSNLTKPVTISLPVVEEDENHTCVFWDHDASDWSTKGIKTILDVDSGTVTCKSDHLTNFAVLLSPNAAAVHSEQGLTYITYIGCAISIACLVITLITYGLFRCLHGEKSGKILIHLCIALLLLNVVFLAGTVDVSGFSTLSCTIVALLLHYLVLAALTWMLLEAVEMYQAIVTVFAKYERLYLVKRCIIGWGVPALIVAITASVDIDVYGAKRITGDGETIQICFLSAGSRIAYYVSLLTPACLILVINTIVFIMVARVILKPRFQQQMVNGSTSITPAQVRGTLTVMFLLGVTWVFGPLAIGKATVVFSYLFCICNSLQGCLIFVFRCLFNPEAKLAWLQLFKTGTLKRRRGPIKSGLTDSSISKGGAESSTTNRRLSNSTSTHLSTNYQVGSSSPSSSTNSKTPLYNKSSGSHLHPHQLHNTNGWNANHNGWRRDNNSHGHVINNPLHAGFDLQNPGPGVDDQVPSQSESVMAKRDLLPPNSQENYTDELTHL